jgi:putative ABC transport system ATP-binding protein
MSEFVARLDDLTKVYQMGASSVVALDHLSVEFKKGSFWAIMGKSGSGKSTLLNLLGCLDRPTAGSYILNGRNVAELSDDELSDVRLANIGFIFQSFNLIPQLTVQENIELPGFYAGVHEEQNAARAKELAEMVDLSSRLHHKPAELSGGQRQRVAIARALLNDPPIILADEPTGNLDTATGVQIMDLIRELNSRGKTILMVTHEPDIAAYAGERLFLKDGKRRASL